MFIAKSDKLIIIVTKLAQDVKILKSEKGVPIGATPLVGSTPLVGATPPAVAIIPVDTTPSVSATPLATATPSSTNTPNMPTNDSYWYNSHEGGEVPNDGNDGHGLSSPVIENNSTLMEMD